MLMTVHRPAQTHGPTAADGSGYIAAPAGGVDRGFLRARQAANQTASGRPPSITDVTSTDPLPYVAGTHAREGRLRSPWQNCMALGGKQSVPLRRQGLAAVAL